MQLRDEDFKMRHGNTVKPVYSETCLLWTPLGLGNMSTVGRCPEYTGDFNMKIDVLVLDILVYIIQVSAL